MFVLASIEEDMKDAITWWIDILERAWMQPNGYENVIIDGDPFDNCTENDILKVREKCLFLIKALRLALLNYPKQTWRVCCEEAAMACSEFGSEYKGHMVECWWCTFQNKNAFPHPKGQEANTSMYQQKLPPFF